MYIPNRFSSRLFGFDLYLCCVLNLKLSIVTSSGGKSIEGQTSDDWGLFCLKEGLVAKNFVTSVDVRFQHFFAWLPWSWTTTNLLDCTDWSKESNFSERAIVGRQICNFWKFSYLLGGLIGFLSLVGDCWCNLSDLSFKPRANFWSPSAESVI